MGSFLHLLFSITFVSYSTSLSNRLKHKQTCIEIEPAMAEELETVGLFYDDINKVRVLETTVLKDTEDLRDTCKDYDAKLQDFSKIISSLLEVLKELGDNIEKKKMAAIGSTNILKSIAKEREAEQAKLQAEINDKTLLLEKLDSEYDALQILEATQTETIEYLTQLR